MIVGKLRRLTVPAPAGGGGHDARTPAWDRFAEVLGPVHGTVSCLGDRVSCSIGARGCLASGLVEAVDDVVLLVWRHTGKEGQQQGLPCGSLGVR